MAVLTSDFQIFQRNAEGYADITVKGEWKQTLSEGVHVETRVIREDDSVTVVPWTVCELNGEEYSGTLKVPEGGLYRIETCVRGQGGYWNSTFRRWHHVGVGDIYITAGQSNMTGYGRDFAYDPPVLGVHEFANYGGWEIATHPVADPEDTKYGFPEDATGTSPVLSFGRRLHERLGIPVGVVPTAIGGSPLSIWHPGEDASAFRAIEARLESIGEFKGFIWYQGCTDANENADKYYDRFAEMVRLWNEKLGFHPVLTVQLNKWTAGDDKSLVHDRQWGIIREAQRKAGTELEGVYVVPALDLPMSDGIHNCSGANVIIGERLANVALAEIYGKPGIKPCSVELVEYLDETHIMLHITPGHIVCAMDSIAYGMNVEDESGIIDCTRAEYRKDALYVTTAKPFSKPAVFHYAWRCVTPAFPAKDAYGMPLLACYGIEIK